jgi:hypothetical protein
MLTGKSPARTGHENNLREEFGVDAATSLLPARLKVLGSHPSVHNFVRMLARRLHGHLAKTPQGIICLNQSTAQEQSPPPESKTAGAASRQGFSRGLNSASR